MADKYELSMDELEHVTGGKNLGDIYGEYANGYEKKTEAMAYGIGVDVSSTLPKAAGESQASYEERLKLFDQGVNCLVNMGFSREEAIRRAKDAYGILQF